MKAQRECRPVYTSAVRRVGQALLLVDAGGLHAVFYRGTAINGPTLLFGLALWLASSGIGFSQSTESDLRRSTDWIFQPHHHEVDLHWKRCIESNLLWMIDRAEHPVQRHSGSSLVGVYADAGVWPLGAHSVVASLEESGIAVELLEWSRLQGGNLKRFDAIVFPGGYSYFQQVSAGHRGLDAVREYVKQGGCYLGICAGAFLAAKEVHWEGQVYPYPLALFDGIAEGSIPQIAAWPKHGRSKLSVTDAGDKFGLQAVHGREFYC